MPRSLITIFLLCLSPLLVAETEIYKWTDENGGVHYGSRPGNDNAVNIEIEPAPGLPADHAARKEKQRRLLNLYKEEREEKLEQKARAEQEKQERIAKCQRARDYYKTIKTAALLYDVDDNGNQVILDEPERQAEENRIIQYMDDWCD